MAPERCQEKLQLPWGKKGAIRGERRTPGGSPLLRDVDTAGGLNYHRQFAVEVWPQTLERPAAPVTLPDSSSHEAYFPAQQPPPREDPRLPRAHEHEERPPRPEAPSRQGPQAAHRLVRGLGSLPP